MGLIESRHVSRGMLDMPNQYKDTEAAELVHRVSNLVSPKLASLLQSSNVALVLGGLRGVADIYIDNPGDVVRDQVSLINNELVPHGIAIGPLISNNDDEGATAQVMSLSGFNRATAMTDIPGITPFDPNDGWDGVSQWFVQSLASVRTDLEKEQVSLPEDSILHALIGVQFGYPDTAIASLVENGVKSISSLHQPNLVAIPHTREHGGALPLFHCEPELVDAADVQRTVGEWGSFLGEFYKALGLD